MCFDGSDSRDRQESDTTGPLGVYGRTKLEGEQSITASGCKHLVIPTSWVYYARGGNFVKTMLRMAQEPDRLRVIDDQIGATTGADLIADVTAHTVRAALPKPELSGLYHLVASGETSWHNYGKYVIDRARQLHPELDWKVNGMRQCRLVHFGQRQRGRSTRD